MPATPVSRSSAPFEIAAPSRRPERNAPEQAFTLPAEPPAPANDVRPRIDDDRARRDTREGELAADRPEPQSRSSRNDAPRPDRKDHAGRSDRAAKSGPTGEGGKADKPVETSTDEASAESQDGKIEAAAGDKPAAGQTVEERKAILAAALEGAPVIGQGLPEQAAVPVPPAPVAVPVGITAEFLALAALALQGGGSAKAEGTATQAGKDGAIGIAATSEAAAAAQASVGAVLPLVQAAVAAKAEGKASAGGEGAIAELKAGVKLQLPAAAVEAGVKAAGSVTAEAKAPEGKDAGEAGKATTPQASGEIKPAEAPAAGTQTAQPAQPDEAAPAGNAPQAPAPLSPQAILAAGPQTLIRPDAPRTELDAAAQATAQAQAEAQIKASPETSRPTPLHIVPVEIGARALAGNRRFDIRLDPAELGRVDVSLEISDKGDVSARLTVDRVETLHMLQRDARTLERAFEQAGLKPSDSGVEISLRDPSDQSGSRQQQRQDEEGPRTRRAWVETSEESALVAESVPLRRAGRLGGVDLSV